MRRTSLTSLGALLRRTTVAAALAALTGCNLAALPDNSRPAVANTCKDDADCGNGAVCTAGACFSRSGSIDEVLLEIVPETSSSFGGVSFVSIQDDLRRGNRQLNIALAGLTTFTTQVVVNGEDIPTECGYQPTGRQTIAARLQFRRTAWQGVSLAILTDNPRVTVDTVPHVTNPPSDFNQQVSLVPGTYDIYVQPLVSGNCQIAPRVLRGVDIEQGLAWEAPATITLATARKLEGTVQRIGSSLDSSLANWQVDLIDPQEGNVISTSAKLGATTAASDTTNFAITYQPLSFHSASAAQRAKALGGPLIRLRPPKEQESSTPAVYFDLEASDLTGSGQVKLNLSKLPAPNQMVTVSGQVHGANDTAGVRATLQFYLQGGTGLSASFGHQVTTDTAGNYSTKLLAGSYGLVITPEGAGLNSAPGDSTPRRQWAITQRERVVITQDSAAFDIAVSPTHVIEGMASAGTVSRVAQGANLEAVPIKATESFLRTILSPAVYPTRGSVAVDDNNGRFSLTLDSGDFDLALRPAAASNFAWWVWPRRAFGALDVPAPTTNLDPQLLYPVPVEGSVTVKQNGALVPLSNATIQAYAPTPGGELAKVGTARTDSSGHYYLALPPRFGGQ